jgi:hypothetical protein
MDSTVALELEKYPPACWWSAAALSGRVGLCLRRAGQQSTVVGPPDLMPGTDPDLVKPLQRHIGKR